MGTAENTDPDPVSVMEGAPRKGSAFDGDSFQDKNFYDGSQSKQRKEERARNPPTEMGFAAFLNSLAATSSPGSSQRNSWYGCFSTRPLPPEEGQAKWDRKPDLVLLADGDVMEDSKTITWGRIKALGELTTQSLGKNTTLIKSLNTKAYILFCAQPWRRYVLAISVANEELRIHLYDRSGVVISPPINLHRNITETFRIIGAFADAGSALLGFDPTLEIFPARLRPLSPPYIGTVEVDGITYNIIKVLWTSNGFVGRCTNVYHVRSQKAPLRINNEELDQYDLVVKDVWLEAHLVEHEQKILERIAGIEGVPLLVKAWTVQRRGVPDTTSCHRPTHWSRDRLTPNYAERIHRRLLMTPVGSPLYLFKSQREFLCGLITGLESMYHPMSSQT